MPRKSSPAAVDVSAFESAGHVVIPTELQDEVEESFLEYAYSVIHSRALPDARDGLKPVHRRILFGMAQAGLRPDHAHVKCARIVGDVMGRYHPHGDSAIYEALVRLGQNFATSTPLVDPHGNFGSPNDPPAAMRYTEARLSAVAMAMVSELGEATVDMVENYDGSLTEPSVLPAEFPYLLVNGSTGIAVGMATKMAPHNLGEVVALTRAMLSDPDISLKQAMKMVPGPDFPTGGLVLGADGITDAYRDGKGTIRIRARATIDALEGSRGRQVITITELPYEVGTEKIIDAIKSEISKKRLDGISDVKDLSDRNHGTRLVIECKTGINANVLLAELYRLTPLEVTFGISNLALVDGRPQTLGLLDLVRVFLAHRRDTVRRRTQYRLDKAQARLHIVEGLLIALNAIDAVVKIIKASATTADARAALMKKFTLSDIQAGHILDMPLRRLVALEVQALTDESVTLGETIRDLSNILNNPEVLDGVIDEELRALAEEHAVARRSTLVSGDLAEVISASTPAAPLEAADEPCVVMLSTTGRIGYRVTPHPDNDTATTPGATGGSRGGRGGKLGKHAALHSSIASTTHGHVLLVAATGSVSRVRVLDLPALPSDATTVASGAPVGEYIQGAGQIVGLVPADLPEGALGVFLATGDGVVKVCTPDWPTRSDTFDVITLKGTDQVVAVAVAHPGHTVALVANDAQLLRFPIDVVRPQGRSGGGVAGMKLGDGAKVLTAFCGELSDATMVATYTGTSVKVTPLMEFPAKGRATGGVRSHRFLKGEESLAVAAVGEGIVFTSAQGVPSELPPVDRRRDGSGAPVDNVAGFGGIPT